jgi:hypothetical protein
MAGPLEKGVWRHEGAVLCIYYVYTERARGPVYEGGAPGGTIQAQGHTSWWDNLDTVGAACVAPTNSSVRTSPILTLTTDEGALDLFDSVAGIGSYQDVVKQSVPVDGGEVRFLALGLPGLIDSKRAAGRTRDLAQIPELEALLEITKLGPQGGGE